MVQETLDIHIMGRKFLVSFRPEEREILLDAVIFLEQQMSAMRDLEGVMSVERLALMVAFKLAVERVNIKTDAGNAYELGACIARLDAIQTKIDAVLSTVKTVSLQHGSG